MTFLHGKNSLPLSDPPAGAVSALKNRVLPYWESMGVQGC